MHYLTPIRMLIHQSFLTPLRLHSIVKGNLIVYILCMQNL